MRLSLPLLPHDLIEGLHDWDAGAGAGAVLNITVRRWGGGGGQLVVFSSDPMPPPSSLQQPQPGATGRQLGKYGRMNLANATCWEQ